MNTLLWKPLCVCVPSVLHAMHNTVYFVPGFICLVRCICVPCHAVLELRRSCTAVMHYKAAQLTSVRAAADCLLNAQRLFVHVITWCVPAMLLYVGAFTSLFVCVFVCCEIGASGAVWLW